LFPPLSCEGFNFPYIICGLIITIEILKFLKQLDVILVFVGGLASNQLDHFGRTVLEKSFIPIFRGYNVVVHTGYVEVFQKWF
jgi:hypothetical protein